nr:MAG TPA: hypothetical protein [Caudoviricetes sp.]
MYYTYINTYIHIYKQQLFYLLCLLKCYKNIRVLL